MASLVELQATVSKRLPSALRNGRVRFADRSTNDYVYNRLSANRIGREQRRRVATGVERPRQAYLDEVRNDPRYKIEDGMTFRRDGGNLDPPGSVYSGVDDSRSNWLPPSARAYREAVRSRRLARQVLVRGNRASRIETPGYKDKTHFLRNYKASVKNYHDRMRRYGQEWEMGVSRNPYLKFPEKWARQRHISQLEDASRGVGTHPAIP